MRFDNGWEAVLDPGKGTGFFGSLPRESRPSRLGPFQGWDLGLAWWLAELSRLIYLRDGRDELLRENGWREERFFSASSTECAIIRPLEHGSHVTGDLAILVFRGTSDLRDWVTNVRAIPTAWRQGGNVHRGFRSALEKVWREVEEHLDGLDVPGIFTGHSLGGALANLAASARPPAVTYTFGAPRVGDADFVSTLDSPLYRVVNQQDIVTRLPPSRTSGFVHGGRLCQIDCAGHIDIAGQIVERESEGASNSGTSDDDPDQIWDRRRWFDPHQRISDHAPVNYVAHLARLFG